MPTDVSLDEMQAALQGTNQSLEMAQAMSSSQSEDFGFGSLTDEALLMADEMM